MTAAPLLRAAPAVLRVILLALLVLLATRLLAPSADGEGPGVVRLEDGATEALRPLFRGARADLLVRASRSAPTAGELDALSAASRLAPLVAVRPDSAPILLVEPPVRARAGRAAALAYRVSARPGDTLSVRLEGLQGEADSARVVAGGDGWARGAFRLRPARPGWSEWRVRAGGEETATGAWVAPESAPRVLVVAGPPGWESKFVARALEESGARVDLVQPLGRGLEVGGDVRAVPPDAVALAEFDAVLLLRGAAPSAAARRALDEYVSRLGGGVLRVGGEGAAGAAEIAVAGERIVWALPAELAPLPPVTVRSAAHSLPAASAPDVGAAALPGGVPLLVLGAVGRGRAARLGLAETWRWRMEAGKSDEHREFWRGMVDWLAGGARGGPTAAVEDPLGPVGGRAEVRVFAYGEATPLVSLRRPGGEAEPLPLRADPDAPGLLRASFVPAEAGVHALLVGDSVATAMRASADPLSPSDAWARLALLAYRSGGETAGAGALDAVVGRRTAREGGDGPSIPPTGLLALVVLVAGAEWAVRRLTGRA